MMGMFKFVKRRRAQPLLIPITTTRSICARRFVSDGVVLHTVLNRVLRIAQSPVEVASLVWLKFNAAHPTSLQLVVG